MHFRLDELQFLRIVVRVCIGVYVHTRKARQPHLLTSKEEKSHREWLEIEPNTPNPYVVCHVHKSLLMRCLLCHLLL